MKVELVKDDVVVELHIEQELGVKDQVLTHTASDNQVASFGLSQIPVLIEMLQYILKIQKKLKE